MNLLEQSPWWFVPFILLTMVMLHAMMAFTVSLLVQRPLQKRKPIRANELRQRLLTLNETDEHYQIDAGQDCDLEIYWKLEEAGPPGGLAIYKAASDGRLRLLLDEQRHELRVNQVSRSYYFFLGLAGRLPRLRGYAAFHSGPPGHALTDEISRIANRGGWSVRPVLWWFEATHRGHYWLNRLTPAPLRQWPARRLWGFVYPISYILAIGYLVLIIGPFDQRDWLILATVSIAWWGMWGFLVWLLCGLPRFWRRNRR